MSEVQYEVLRQDRGTGTWCLFEVLGNREDAIARARHLLHERRADAVRVVKETFDQTTGGYVSLTLFEDGRINRKVKNTKIDELEGSKPCLSIDDLYTYEARSTVARTLNDWLTKHKVTVTELMHSAAMLHKLNTQGMVLQHAIQKMAVAQAFNGERTVTQIVRQLDELCMTGIRRIHKDDKDGLFDGGVAGKFAALAEKLSRTANGAYRLNGALTKYLAPARGWDAKLALLLALMDELPQAQEPRALLFGAVDGLMAELLSNSAALADLLGPHRDLGHAMLNLAALFMGTDVLGAPLSAGVLKNLSRRFENDELPEARAAVASRILAELRSMKRLCPASLDDEFAMMHRLNGVLVRARGRYLLHEDLLAVFVERSKRLVTHEPLLQYMQTARTPDQKLERLLTVEENIIGAENKRELATFIMPLITSQGFEAQMPQGVVTRLKRIVVLQDRVLNAGFQAVQMNQIAAALDSVAKGIEERAKLLISLETKVPDPVERAGALLKLASAGVFTQGELLMKARRHMMSTLNTVGFVQAYLAQLKSEPAAPVDHDAALRKLTVELSLFGITHDDASRVLGTQSVFAS